MGSAARELWLDPWPWFASSPRGKYHMFDELVEKERVLQEMRALEAETIDQHHHVLIHMDTYVCKPHMCASHGKTEDSG